MTQYVGLVSSAVWALLVNRVTTVEGTITPEGIEISPPSYDALAFGFADYDAAELEFATYTAMAAGPYYATTAYLSAQLTIVQGYATTATASVADAELAGDRLNGLADFPHPFFMST